ncbi:MAG: Uma2 family endonuclease [Planctomycetia bacterium]|nr:Uma2 family endonuclease [Planctomycetia bacterium]
MATIEALLTAEEFFAIPRGDQPKELVQGRIIYMTPPGQPHGLVCIEIGFILRSYLATHDIGRVVGNDSGCITARDPDSVRGPDIAFYRHDQIPEKPFPPGYWKAVPPLACEVLSPSDVWAEVLEKVTEYFRAGVIVVCVFDPARETIQVFRGDRQPESLSGDAELKLPEVLGEEFAVPAKKFFV